MSLSNYLFDLKLTWVQERANPGTNVTAQSGSLESSLAGLDVTVWDESYHAIIDLTTTNPAVEIDLTDLENYVGDAFGFTKVLQIAVRNLRNETLGLDGVVVFSPGDTQPFSYGFYDPSDALLLTVGRCIFLGDDVDSTEDWIADRVVTDTAKNLKLELVEGSTAQVEILILGSTLETA